MFISVYLERENQHEGSDGELVINSEHIETLEHLEDKDKVAFV